MTGQKIIMTDPKTEDYFYEEAIKTLRTNIQFAGMDIKTITVTSCYPNEGKSDIAFQLAKEIGNMNKKVLFVDADIRKSSMMNRYQVKSRVSGLTQYLSGQVGRNEIFYNTNFPNLDIIFAGPMAPNPSELLEQASFEALMEFERSFYDYVIVDTPPIGNLIDAAVVAKQCDGAILVIESGAVSRRVAEKAKEQLEKSGCRVLGAVLNKVDMRRDRYYSRYSSKYSNYYNSSNERK
ncbi:CpsD/CapB family tyrosine-protein kinase [Mediterraneibacter glycyrrhizinilyticus]|uniref:CpsD/CapB family tyrosine-protein kinase n=1 Tax=Mediterraneibacter glycyrrhizinilyticus TaxID=342942 RepID=UPI0019614DFB|nr:CpsD/CapB family tyrosine-protein kinase [Mediterraneibacter glycyrrhizinilyticus]MBM6751512.1 CpsD/CapB family tyrosine-protein kinase [Mediterraneibacter glycyrrhizinilyticus]